MTHAITTKRLGEAALHPLYNQYPGQSSPQGAYVEIDSDAATVTAACNPEIGNAVPFDVWHGHRQRFPVSPDLTAAELNQLLDTVAPHAARVVAGYQSVWDGSNHVAQYTEDAAAAIDEILVICEQAETASGGVWDAADWLGQSTPDEWGVGGDTNDEQLEDIAAQIDAEARCDGITVQGTIDQVRAWREELS